MCRTIRNMNQGRRRSARLIESPWLYNWPKKRLVYVDLGDNSSNANSQEEEQENIETGHGDVNDHQECSGGILPDINSYTSQKMPSESCNSEYVHDETDSTTDVSKRDNSCDFAQNKNLNQHALSQSITKAHVHTQPLRSLDQISSGYRSASQFHSSGSIDNQHAYSAPDTGLKYRSNAIMGEESDGLNPKEKCNTHVEFEANADSTRGPRFLRGRKVRDEPPFNPWLWLSVRRELYNLEDFQIKYDNAKFYIVKSFTEDDIHKSIKYNVWSSTPCGNRKLDAAFHEAQDETSEPDTVCPIFLFFSVNGSGQFVGVAEMIGKVDFAKNLNFWLSDRWNGFFPVKWHIVKDIPSRHLRHIIIESNVKKPVTHTRDMQEIGLQQGLEMLRIFKNYTEVTSFLDDLNFYEKRELSLKAKRNKHARYSDRDMKEQEKEQPEDLLPRSFPKPRKS